LASLACSIARFFLAACAAEMAIISISRINLFLRKPSCRSYECPQYCKNPV
jgi:hypothetical protein